MSYFDDNERRLTGSTFPQSIYDFKLPEQKGNKQMRYVFQSMTTENVVKGKSRYTKAVIEYTYNGEARKHTMMSFANPTVFKQLESVQPGQELEVEVVKNEMGFNEWKSVTVANIDTPSVKQGPATNSSNAAGTTKVVGSNYETREERAARQVLIVRQSSLSSAVASLTPGAKSELLVDNVIAIAQMYVDWVFDNDHTVPE